MKKMYGLSLVELLVSIAVGVILMTGVMQVFLSAKSSYSTQQALGRVQENSRFILELIGKDIRNIGYGGCGDMARKIRLSTSNGTFSNYLKDASTKPIVDFSNPISGENNVATTLNLGFGTPITPKVGTDVLFLKSVGELSSEVASVANNNASNLGLKLTTTSANACSYNGTSSDMVSGLCAGDILMVSDCAKSVVFQATGLNAANQTIAHSTSTTFSPGNTTDPWPSGLAFSAGAEIFKVSSSALFIQNEPITGRPGLYLFALNANPNPILLISDVENMQIQFGVDTSAGVTNDGTPEQYVNPANTINWSKVVSVKLSFLLASPEAALQENQVIQFDDFNTATTNDTVDTSDRRLRQVVNMTIALRNRLPSK
jgi:type IV pilus assembly protein PilW